MSRPHILRNKDLVEKHETGWSFRALAHFFHLDVSTVSEIYHRDKSKYGRKKRHK